jgi:hypothetical protein
MALFVGQAFLYNAIFFTYALVLTKIYGINNATVGLYLLPFAVGNFFGPLLLGRLFDTVGRKPMIAPGAGDRITEGEEKPADVAPSARHAVARGEAVTRGDETPRVEERPPSPGARPGGAA